MNNNKVLQIPNNKITPNKLTPHNNQIPFKTPQPQQQLETEKQPFKQLQQALNPNYLHKNNNYK